ncbi:acyl-CoA thioesterase II [Nakamurella sp. YIM 132087]|uniref:Acyl-CoA thioesterase 2 n=1 Tax=Nakamurella alba TaxID=2665158 RepID=A0A7K1FRH6_9ACTN|nr:acyl-CoA thioesterase II [Nakamurella alba]MTD16751.1 acyl-CoA thioesterase II [Nakamurella alba]
MTQDPLIHPASSVRGQTAVDAVVALLDLERLEDDLFRGVSPEISPVRVFGGQVAGQALVATGRTVPPDRRVHSLHAYFIRGGDPRVPIIYQVERVRDGRSFTTRRVTAVQHGKTIFAMSSSWQSDEEGMEHEPAPLDVPPPDQVPTLDERLTAVPDTRHVWAHMPRPFDIRYVELPTWLMPPEQRVAAPEERVRVWIRPDGRIPDDPLLHVCLLAYVSDLTLLDTVLRPHGVVAENTIKQMASLDHAMWFHRPIRFDDWVLYEMQAPVAAGGRGLATGAFLDADGHLLTTVVQEGLVRVRG